MSRESELLINSVLILFLLYVGYMVTIGYMLWVTIELFRNGHMKTMLMTAFMTVVISWYGITAVWSEVERILDRRD